MPITCYISLTSPTCWTRCRFRRHYRTTRRRRKVIGN
ncbi:hypothetical protein [Klebsiella phage pKP-M186-2.1]|nr:hypothetical protein [Klebsiella phage pKP-M186-2.1]